VPNILLALVFLSAAAEELPKPIFYLPLDGTAAAAIAGGGRHPQDAVHAEPILALVEWRRTRFSPGRVGQCYDAGDSPLVFACAGNFRADEGACSLWLSPQFRGDDANLYAAFLGAAKARATTATRTILRSIDVPPCVVAMATHGCRVLVSCQGSLKTGHSGSLEVGPS